MHVYIIHDTASNLNVVVPRPPKKTTPLRVPSPLQCLPTVSAVVYCRLEIVFMQNETMHHIHNRDVGLHKRTNP